MSYRNRHARRQARNFMRYVLRFFGTSAVRLLAGQGHSPRTQASFLQERVPDGLDDCIQGSTSEKGRQLQAASRFQ